MPNPLKVSTRAVDALPHFSNASSASGLKSILRKARKRASRIVTHGSPSAVSSRKDKARSLLSQSEVKQLESSRLAQGLESYKSSVSDVANQMKRTRSGSQAAALYQTSGLAKKMPTLSSGTVDPIRNQREGVKKLLKTRGGRQSINTLTQHEKGTVNRLSSDILANQRSALRNKRHAQAQAQLARDAADNATGNAVVGGAAALTTGSGAYALYKKKQRNNRTLEESSLTRQKLR